MHELFKSAYYWLDLLVGFGGPVVLYVLIRLGIAQRRDGKLFWLGAGIGLTWEVPIFLFSKYSATPVIAWVTEPPVHVLVLLVCHTFWDGMLFVTGMWLARLLLRRPVLETFSWGELVVLIAWGQVTAFLVEYSSITSGAWTYLEGIRWNPVLFHVGGHPVTIMMQWVWLVAAVVFYLVALRAAKADAG